MARLRGKRGVAVAVAGVVALAGAVVGLLVWGLPSAPRRVPSATLPDVAATAQTADRVVLGTVRGARAHWDGGRIVTDLDVDVERTLRGRSGGTMTARLLGGSVDGIAMRVPGVELPAVGARLIVMSARAGGAADDEPMLARGVLSVARDEHGRDVVTWPDARGGTLLPVDDIAGKLEAGHGTAP